LYEYSLTLPDGVQRPARPGRVFQCPVRHLLAHDRPVRAGPEQDEPARPVEHGRQRPGRLLALAGGLLQLDRLRFPSGGQPGYVLGCQHQEGLASPMDGRALGRERSAGPAWPQLARRWIPNRTRWSPTARRSVGLTEVKAAGVQLAAPYGRQQQAAPQVLGVGRQSVQRAARAVVVEQPRWHAQQLGERGRRRPRRHVVQRGGAAQPVGHQGGDHLAVGEQGVAPHRGDLVDQAGHPETAQVVGDDQQRADIAPGAEGRWAQAREGPGPAVQLARRLQFVQAAQRCDNALADLAALPVALHELHVLRIGSPSAG